VILVPEIETVVLLVPRTGSGSLRRAVLAKYPRAMQVYRHMEADGVPVGYDMWPKVGVVRNPVERLWSLYKFLRTFGEGKAGPGGYYDPTFVQVLRNSVLLPFSRWIVENETVFTAPYDRACRGRFWPQFMVRHPLPENRKSQFLYLRPDLGTIIYPYDSLDELARRLDVQLGQHHRTEPSPLPVLDEAAQSYMLRAFAWDFGATAAPIQKAA
jgi:hypothetical protein